MTFGVGALSLATERMAERGATGPAHALAPILFVVANVVIGGIAAASLFQLSSWSRQFQLKRPGRHEPIIGA
jgi:tellurite resistance protein